MSARRFGPKEQLPQQVQPVASKTGTNSGASALRAGQFMQEAEAVMSTFTHPPKHLVREYLQRRKREASPPPTPDEIRRQLGWAMLMPTPKIPVRSS